MYKQVLYSNEIKTYVKLLYCKLLKIGFPIQITFIIMVNNNNNKKMCNNYYIQTTRVIYKKQCLSTNINFGGYFHEDDNQVENYAVDSSLQ